MNEGISKRFETLLVSELGEYLTSGSHGIEHLQRVMHFANQLHTIHGGDLEVIAAAVWFHDLGRALPSLEGKDSARKSAELAEPILLESGMRIDKVELACEAIAEHDQPNVRPRSVEGKILKDADFLAGIGAQGVLRSALWTGEKQQDLNKFLERLEDKMVQRIASLEFPESKIVAQREYLFVGFFLEQLSHKADVLPIEQNGRLIVLEGISGTGKDLQALRLKARLEQRKRTVLLVADPSAEMSPTWRFWKNELHSFGADDAFGQLLLYTLDRYAHSSPKTKIALKSGWFVISVRNYLSSMVYQSGPQAGPSYIAFLSSFAPRPDALILLDVPADVAWSRIQNRRAHTGQPLGDSEELSKLERHRHKYLELARQYFPDSCVIDAAQSMDTVEQSIWDAVSILD